MEVPGLLFTTSVTYFKNDSNDLDLELKQGSFQSSMWFPRKIPENKNCTEEENKFWDLQTA